MESDDEDEGDVSIECSLPDSSPRSAFQSILQKSSLANSLKIVFEELSNTGNFKIGIFIQIQHVFINIFFQVLSK